MESLYGKFKRYYTVSGKCFNFSVLGSKIFTEKNLVAVHFIKANIKLGKRACIGFAILDISKNTHINVLTTIGYWY
jgi:hypothetical protein